MSLIHRQHAVRLVILPRYDPHRNGNTIYHEGYMFMTRTDKDILDEIQEKLMAFTDLDLSQITVSLADGIARLAGSVASILGKRAAHEIAENVRGILGVENEIMTDSEVEARVITALLSDPHTYLAIIEPKVENGVVTLTGVIDSDIGQASAIQIAAAQKGVAAVINKLKVETEA